MHWDNILPVLHWRFQMKMEHWYVFVRFKDIQVKSPRLNYVTIRHKWKPLIYLVGPSTRPRLNSRSWIDGRRRRKERGKTNNFLVCSYHFNNDASEAELIADIKKPRKVHYYIHLKPGQDASCWTHLSTAQDAGLEFGHIGSAATLTYQPVPKECVVKVSAKMEAENCSPENLHLEKDH